MMEIDERYPNAKVIIAHVGRAYIPSDVGDAFEVLKNTKNLYFDFSANTSAYAMAKMFEAVGTDRVMFGTDMPFTKMRMFRIEKNGTYVNVVPRGIYGDVSNDSHMEESDDPNITTFVYEELLAVREAAIQLGLTREDIEKIFCKNAAAYFDIKI
jgi:predicted TIM-barrel fold metal-dependent hydrolase